MSFQPSEILRVLDDAGVEFVVVGGLAAIAHGASFGPSASGCERSRGAHASPDAVRRSSMGVAPRRS